jgi:hypothetical protein
MPLQTSMTDSQSILTQLIFDLYRRAAQLPPTIELQIKLIDSPKLAHEVFKNPDIFIKNYPFLEKLSSGRMSTSGSEWEKRAKLTQVFYYQSTHSVSDEQIDAVYVKNLLNCQMDVIGQLREALIQSAVEVISLSYRLSKPIPWESYLIKNIAAILQEEQAAACLFPDYRQDSKNHALQQSYLQIRDSWNAIPELKEFLEMLSIQGADINCFDAVGELIQNLFAASETTASSLMWAIEVLGRNQEFQISIREQRIPEIDDFFIDEVLRLYPPLPLLTRMVTADCEFEGACFTKNEQIIISIVGINCHHDYWEEALNFHLPRKEFLNKSYKTIAYKPFISGPRVCGGLKLARRELKIALKAILTLYMIKSIETPIAIQYGLTCSPATPLEHYLNRITT